MPKNFAQGVASRGKFSWDSSFWVFNWVSNQAYARWSDMSVDVQKEQGALEGQFLADQADVEQTALEQLQAQPRGGAPVPHGVLGEAGRAGPHALAPAG